MTYEEALNYLDELAKFGSRPGLARIEKLLELMQHPERDFKSIHITGTNGKGSTTAMLTAILNTAGIKAGMYISPHLVNYTERMVVNGTEISQAEFAECIKYTKKYVDVMIKEGFEHPTQFEVLTAAAFYYFKIKKVEYAVIEVGLGGLLDSTNVITPEIAIITNVTLEHTDKCGNTVEEIAAHKSGIIKNGVPVITAASGAALEIIKRTAAEKQAAIYVLREDFYSQFSGMDNGQQMVTVKTNKYGDLGTFAVKLLGIHQVENSAVAIMAAMVLAEREERINTEAIQTALKQVFWPGRFEIIPGQPTIVIDGAHNVDGAKKLRKNLESVYPNKDIVFLLGILRDKDVKGILDELIRPNDIVVAASPISERAGEPEYIINYVNAKHKETAKSIADALERVSQLAAQDRVICIAGSLYLIGYARKLLGK